MNSSSNADHISSAAAIDHQQQFHKEKNLAAPIFFHPRDCAFFSNYVVMNSCIAVGVWNLCCWFLRASLLLEQWPSKSSTDMEAHYQHGSDTIFLVALGEFATMVGSLRASLPYRSAILKVKYWVTASQHGILFPSTCQVRSATFTANDGIT